jgi:hypothetical protein
MSRIRLKASSEHAGETRAFWRHVFEMTGVMILGMMVLGMTFRFIHLAVFGTGFDDAWHNHTELAVFAMTFNMTLPMVGLMRWRGHDWERCNEMAAAMFGLALAMLVLFWLKVISDEVVLPLEMVLMVPVMVVVMGLRFDEYAGHPRAAPSPDRVERPPRAA